MMVRQISQFWNILVQAYQKVWQYFLLPLIECLGYFLFLFLRVHVIYKPVRLRFFQYSNTCLSTERDLVGIMLEVIQTS